MQLYFAAATLLLAFCMARANFFDVGRSLLNTAEKYASVGSVAITGIVSTFLLDRSLTGQRLRFRYLCRTPVPECGMDHSVAVANPEAEEAINCCFNDEFNGVRVIYSPVSTGKTTYLRKVAAQSKDKMNIIYFANGVRSTEDLYRTLGVKPWFPLSDVFQPVSIFGYNIGKKRTVLVFDQQEQARNFDVAQQELILSLATDSLIRRNYLTIVALSDIKRARAIMDLNGHTKIQKLGSASMFRWGVPQAQSFAKQSKVLQALPDASRHEAVELGVRAGACGFFFELCSQFSPKGNKKLEIGRRMHKIADVYNKAWEAAKAWDEL